MSFVLKTEAGLVLQGRTYMKEVDKTEFLWTVENVNDFKTWKQVAVSPKFPVGESGKHGTFHLELAFSKDPRTNQSCCSLALVRGQAGSVNIKSKIRCPHFRSPLIEETIEFSEKNRHELASMTYFAFKKLVIKVELAVFEPAWE